MLAAESLEEMNEYQKKEKLSKKEAFSYALKSHIQVNQAKLYPDDFSDLKGKCAFR